ncbi:MAG TPA: ATP-dependent RecD-like DNA helicase [Candidatus Sumerlaeota bacterium]|nr:MAG: ATP-dependent RecD-like DNA helicase [candidate division BRC1 bacterium ADurb.Bin183]HON50994.1 ATP-dependent RecD-like DNA helicase [Candidatus Sumerlaeota bacterium]HOR65750.1 ATP-dependent RecD-like DNA helicase [Candidatus Sumerlaeota bacterium]HPL75505.1 ATP-dependent RecD-like DNA helicase [Candidatus Sumerlaeota bacterium]
MKKSTDTSEPLQSQDNLISLEGSIETFRFESEQDGFAVATFSAEGQHKKIIVVGALSGISPGETVRLWGRWITHPKFGEQFDVKTFIPILPASVAGICRYLSSGLIKGIGKKFAKRITEKFGAQTLDIIDKDSDRLSEVRDIGPKRLNAIKSAWREHRLIRDIMVFLHSHNLSMNLATKIFRQYREQAIKVLREDPYRLALDISGIGFKTADKVAHSLGIPKDSPQRIRAGILHVLKEASSDEGHTFLPENILHQRAMEILEIGDVDEIKNAQESLAEEDRIVIENTKEEIKAVFPKALHICERGVAERIAYLCSLRRAPFRNDSESAILAFEQKFNFKLASLQKEAVSLAMNGGIMVITGGPGTGKTTIIRAIIDLLSHKKLNIRLTAPTGRAAKRMEETTGMESQTIHRLLKYNPKLGKFIYDEINPLPADLLIVDETSMMDIVLAYHLLKAIGRQTPIIFVGDADQLPSVGPGNFLQDMIHSGVVPVICLTEIFRQARQSLIVVNAHKINHGEFPIIPKMLDEDDALPDFFFIPREDPEEALAALLKVVSERIPSRFNLDPVSQIQVVTPMYKGVIGALNLNRELQKLLNPNLDYISRGGQLLRLGDKVMQLRNNYDKDVYNGDVGIVVGFDREFQTLRVRFEGRVIDYEFSELEDLTLAYAITVHKAQGSEYPAVVIPVMTQHYIMLQRNLLYTAVTRGKKLVCLIGTKKALAIAVRNAKHAERNSALAEWMQALV